MSASKKQISKDYAFYIISLFLTVPALWLFIADSPSKLGLLSGDEQYWLNDFSTNGFFSYIFKIDAQNPYLSVLPRSLSWLGFQLGGDDFQGSEGMLLIRLITFSLLALSLTFPIFPPVRKMLKIELSAAVVFWLFMLSLSNSENAYVFNFSYYAIVPILLLFSVINRSDTSLNKLSKIQYACISLSYFLGTIVIINKALLAAITLVGSFCLLCFNITSRRDFQKLINIKLLSILFACSLLILLTKSEDAASGYTFSTLGWAISGVFFAIGSFFLPAFAISLDSIARQHQLDYLVGATKLFLFLSGLLLVIGVIVYFFKFAQELSVFRKVKIEVLVTIIMFIVSIFSLSYSQYSAWYLGNWFFSAGESLFVRHFVVPQTCLVYLMILLLRILNIIESSIEHNASTTRLIFKLCKSTPILVIFQTICIFVWKLFQ